MTLHTNNNICSYSIDRFTFKGLCGCSFTYIFTALALFVLLSLTVSNNANAAWFSSTGQAVIINGDKERAKSEAIEEAIKQAMLFAGASVRSVQQMTNGLLMDDHLEIRANGEVNTIELIEEVYQNGIVTVSIRADIFAQDTECSAADYTKRFATTHFPLAYPAQAADGQIHQLGTALGNRISHMFNRLSTNLNISQVEPYKYDWSQNTSATQSQILASKTNVQYVMGLVITDISIARKESSYLNPWSDDTAIRKFAFDLMVYDGSNGDKLLTQSYHTSAPWQFEPTETVDVNSDVFWQSPYGKSIEKSIHKAVVDMEQRTICEPTRGRILAVANNQLQINLGQNQKVQRGDQLTLFSVKEIQDTFGQTYRQFVLHPTRLVVSQVFAETATVTSIDGSLLANIQANDYVARQ